MHSYKRAANQLIDPISSPQIATPQTNSEAVATLKKPHKELVKMLEPEAHTKFPARGSRQARKLTLLLLLPICLIQGAPSVKCGSALDLDDPTGYFSDNSLEEKYEQQLTYDQYVTYAIRSLALVAGYDNDLHRYDSHKDLLNSFERRTNLTGSGLNLRPFDELDWPHTTPIASDIGGQLASWTRIRRKQSARRPIDSSELELFNEQNEIAALENDLNQADCSKQLDQLIDMALKLYRNFDSYSSSKHLSLIEFFDSFGSAPSSQLMMGNNLWLGAHDQCVSARVQPRPEAVPADERFGPKGGGETIAGRYCVAKLRSPNWQSRIQPLGLGDQSIRLGVCLPRTCNSISILRHSNKLETLIKTLRLQQVPLSSYRLSGLYCLPDESSPLRQLSPSARLFVTTLMAWLAMVLYFSLKYELILARQDGNDDPQLSVWIKIFAFRYCWRALFAAPRQTSAEPLGVSPSEVEKSTSASLFLHSNLLQQKQPKYHNSLANQEKASSLGVATKVAIIAHPRQAPTLTASKAQQIDLSAIDGIKVISMIWLISAHTMLFFVRVITNGRDFWSIVMDARFLTIMAGIFPVDSFFTVTGVLTAYLKFYKDGSKAMKRPSYWLETFVHRYLRFMPMYLFVFWYTRDVSQYLGQGPLWDYATANTSLRSMCKQESIMVPLLFQANFKSIDQHCIKPAWYLANDYQYLLMTPVFVAILMCSKRLGYLTIIVSVISSLLAQFYTVYYDDKFVDFAGLVNFRPMFATYVLKDLWKLYTLPYNRIVPYLIGLMTGHLMFVRSKKAILVAPVGREQNQYYTNKQNAKRREKTKPFSHSNNHGVPNESSYNDSNLEQCECKQKITISSDDVGQGQYQFHFHPHPPPPSTHFNKKNVNIMDANMTVNGTHSIPVAGAIEISHRQDSARSAGLAGELPSSISPNGQGRHQNFSTTSDRILEQPVILAANTINQGKLLSCSFLSHFFRQHLCIRVWAPLMLLISIIYLPMLTKLTTHEGLSARIGAALIIALMRFFWSIAIARLIYVCCCDSNRDKVRGKSSQCESTMATNPKQSTNNDSFIIGLLSSPMWKPWSKIGLSVLLIQWEVIGYLAQIQTTPPFMSISYMLAFVLVSIVASYAIGLILYLTIEFPLSQFEHYYIHSKFFNKKHARTH